MGVATRVQSTARMTLFFRASSMEGSCHTEPTGSCQYQRNEKPCQTLRERPALNENWMAMSTGSSVHAM